MQRPPEQPSSQTWIGILVSELKRRHVIQVVGVYLLTSWGIIQVTTTVFPLIALPAWAATLVFILLLLGLPFVVFFSWTFDITPEGVRRTGSTRDLKLKPPLGRKSILLVIAAALILGAWSWWTRRSIAAELDPDAIAVFPFHVASEESLAYLSEGMVDLLDTKLADADGLHPVNARTVVGAWGRATRGEPDLSTYDIARLARTLGAGQMLLGRVVGSPGRISISATLYNAVTGRRRAEAEVNGPADSLLALVDALTAELLSITAGEPRERLTHLATTSLPALRLYLDGQAAYRRTEFGRAVELLEQAFALDSTFALAGLAHAKAMYWQGWDDRGLRLAWRHRDRLTPRDTLLLTAIRAQREVWTPLTIQQRAWERVVEQARDDPDALFFLGDLYYHFGSLLGHRDAVEQAEITFGRALALDSTAAPILVHLIDNMAERSDTAAMRQLAHRYRALSQGASEDVGVLATLWVIGTVLQDNALLQRTRAHFGSSSVGPELAGLIAGKTLHLGLPQADAVAALEAALRMEPTRRGRAAILQDRMNLEMLRGRPAAAAILADSIVELGESAASVRLLQVWHGVLDDADTSTTGHAAREHVRLAGDSLPLRAESLCALASWSLRKKATASARAFTTALRAVPAGANGLAGYDVSGCLAWLDAWNAVLTASPGASDALMRLDSMLVRGELPPGRGFPYAVAGNIISMRLHEERGEHEAALAAARRRLVGMDPRGLATQSLGQARLAHRLGYRDEAIGAYRRYLALRPDPEPGTLAAANLIAAREGLASLAGDHD